jgi:hypothetical protein
VAEQEVRADPDFHHVQPVHEHVAQKRLRIPFRKLEREANHRDALHAGPGQRFDLLVLVISSAGALSGRSTLGGWGSNVIAAAVPARLPRAAARDR